MTKPINVQVVPEELMGRASELESLIAAPTASLEALCALPMVVNATADLVFSANAMLTYIDAGNKARQQLADALREAAKSYVGTDEQVEQALNAGGGAVSAVAPRGVLGAHAPGAGAGLGGVRSGLLAAPSTVPPAPPYYPVRTAATQIAEPDQGTSFNAFAAAWTAYQQPLLDSTEAFRPFQNWQGEAATAVEANFEQFRQWVYQIADLCKQLVAQVQGISSAHSWAVTQHPTVAQLNKLDKQWGQAEECKIKAEHESKLWIRNMEMAIANKELDVILKQYTDYQSRSESVLTEYTKKANLPLSPLNPPVPPTAYSPPAPAPTPAPTPTPTPGSTSGSGTGTGGLPMMPMMGGIPSMGGMGSASKAGLAAASGVPGGPALKPAALGGGAGAGAAMPLQSPSGAGAPASAAAAGGVAAGGGAARGTGAAAGRGGMGMAPVGHGGHGASSPKDKRDQTGQESLYTEDRAWTEALIGGHEPDETPDHAPVTASPPEIDQQLAAALRAAALREALGY